jgi:phosphoglycerol transferase
MAPTILEAIGADLKDGRFALGTSLFSKEKTLLEKYGAAYVNGELAKKSSFYQGLF